METPDLILSNANVITVDDSDTVARAVAVTGGLISAVGSATEMEALAGTGTEVVDLGGRTVVPGFIDAHSHISIGASYIGKADLQTPPVGNTLTVQDVMAKLPPADLYAKAVFPTLDAQEANKKAVTENWDKVVGANVAE